MRNGWVVVLGLFGLACAKTEEAASASASTAGGTGGLGGGGGGGDASGGGGAATGSGGASQVLFPLYDKAAWTYEVTELGAGGECSEGTFSSTLAANGTVDGKLAFEASPWCSATSKGVLYAAGSGDEVFVHDGTKWHVFLDGTLEDGHAWSSNGVPFKWKKLGWQTLHGQKYVDCWAAQRTDVTQTYGIYCRGIGPIKHHSQTGQDGYDAVLK